LIEEHLFVEGVTVSIVNQLRGSCLHECHQTQT
jgi:hypothetical protein